jgi:hypothetical protein
MSRYVSLKLDQIDLVFVINMGGKVSFGAEGGLPAGRQGIEPA